MKRPALEAMQVAHELAPSFSPDPYATVTQLLSGDLQVTVWPGLEHRESFRPFWWWQSRLQKEKRFDAALGRMGYERRGRWESTAGLLGEGEMLFQALVRKAEATLGG